MRDVLNRGKVLWLLDAIVMELGQSLLKTYVLFVLGTA
nr:MAG TPA: hypothetical protein [Caudoviricetes sp.]